MNDNQRTPESIALCILTELASIKELEGTNNIDGNLALVNEALRDAKELAEKILAGAIVKKVA